MKKDYMTRLERWARWMLPRQEAEDVIADYRDIVADEELFRELDTPQNVIKPLVQKRPYYAWLAAFILMDITSGLRTLTPGTGTTWAPRQLSWARS